MQVHNISIKHKYFEPIRNGIINLLIFKTKVLDKESPGDYILAAKGNYDIKAKISRTYIKAFRDITNEEAKRAGFLNKDFLKEELIKEYDLNTVFSLASGHCIDEELFFLVELNNKEDEHYVLNSPIKVNLYSKEYNKEFYNPEYDSKPWREKI